MPNITFDIQSTASGSFVRLTLTPENYIQRDSSGYLFFPVVASSIPRVIFGGVIFDTFYVVMDRDNHRVGFGAGCDCQT